MDKLLNAISETLAKLGLDEETVKAATEEILSKVDEEQPAEEVPPSDDNPATEEEMSDVPPTDDPASAEQQEEVPTEEPAPSDDVPPAEEIGQVSPEEPQPEEVPPVPPFDPTELLAKLDELSKANEGLLARVQSLEDALKQAGVVDESVTSQVGDDTPSVPGEPSDSDIFNEQLKMLNRKPQI